MRYYFLIFFFVAIASSLQGQDKSVHEKGKVSYISSQNVYVKFESTENIEIGDTLFLNKGGELIPSLVVNNKSSISCVCTPIFPGGINVSDEIIYQRKDLDKELLDQQRSAQKDSSSLASDQAGAAVGISLAGSDKKNEYDGSDDPFADLTDKKLKEPAYQQNITGRVSAAYYNTIGNSRNWNRFRYTFFMRGDHLGNSKLSFESYITFRHTLDEWEEVKDNVNDALKVYSLALKYDFSKKTRILLGRHINRKISSIGAVDGLQFEQEIGNFTLGTFVGFRPDYQDYSLNFNLFQYSLYLSHSYKSEARYMENTIAFIEQRNDFNIDRRFIYFQHSSSLAKNLNLFASMEVSLYEKIDDEPKNTLDLMNLYASIRYRISRKLNFSLSYDNRRSIHYYETYKNFIDQLIDEETRQGLRFHASYRIFKNVTWGVNTGWRFQKSERNLSRNLNTYLTFSRIPGVNIRTTLTANFLRTNYLNSKIFGIRISKEIVPRKLNGDIQYRWVDFDYLNYETASRQNILGANLSWNIIKRLSLHLNYEITFDSHDIEYHQVYAKIIQRF
jgi:hypothetical protein